MRIVNVDIDPSRGDTCPSRVNGQHKSHTVQQSQLVVTLFIFHNLQ